MKRRPKIGARVRLTRETARARGVRGRRAIAVVCGHLSGVAGGIILDRMVDGFRCWNALDVELAP